MRALLLAGLAMAGVPVVSHVSAPAAPHAFQVTIAPRGEGYTLTCATGCRWTELSFSCGPDCHAVIDDAGVVAPATTGSEGATFAFRFHRLPNGWELESLGGTRWTSLGWGCGIVGSCTAEVDETGVRSAWI